LSQINGEYIGAIQNIRAEMFENIGKGAEANFDMTLETILTNYISESTEVINFINTKGVGSRFKFVENLAFKKINTEIQYTDSENIKKKDIILKANSQNLLNEYTDYLTVGLTWIFDNTVETYVYDIIKKINKVLWVGHFYEENIKKIESLDINIKKENNWESPDITKKDYILNQIGYHNSSYRLYTKIIENKLNLLRDSRIKKDVELNYKKWGENFNNLENTIENNKYFLEKNKNEIDTKAYSTSAKKNWMNISGNFEKSTIEDRLQYIEQMFINHLGNNYLREVVYSHYGTWIPKYGFFNQVNWGENSYEKLTQWADTYKNTLSELIDKGDWLGYFRARDALREEGELNFLKSYIFTKNRYITKNKLENYNLMEKWKIKKYEYRPFDSYIKVGSVKLQEQMYHKIWNWNLRTHVALSSQYFRDWYWAQYQEEQNDIEKFGVIREITKKKRLNNPEKILIDQVNECFGGGYSKFIENFDINSLDLEKNSKLNKFVEKRIIFCFNRGIIDTNSNKNEIQHIKNLTLNQTEVTKMIADHEKKVNEYRWNSWIK